MYKLFVVFAVLLIATGALLLAVPKEEPRATTRSAGPQVVSLVTQVRNIAEVANAPLSILFGIASLYYSRRRYLVERDEHAHDKNA